MARPLCTAAPERRRVHLDHAPQGDGADTPRRVRATAGRAEAVRRTGWRTVRDHGSSGWRRNSGRPVLPQTCCQSVGLL